MRRLQAARRPDAGRPTRSRAASSASSRSMSCRRRAAARARKRRRAAPRAPPVASAGVRRQAAFRWVARSSDNARHGLFGTRRLVDLRLPTSKPGVERRAGGVRAGPQSRQRDARHAAQKSTARPSRRRGSRRSSTPASVPVWPVEREALPRWIAARLASKARTSRPDTRVPRGGERGQPARRETGLRSSRAPARDADPRRGGRAVADVAADVAALSGLARRQRAHCNPWACCATRASRRYFRCGNSPRTCTLAIVQGLVAQGMQAGNALRQARGKTGAPPRWSARRRACRATSRRHRARARGSTLSRGLRPRRPVGRAGRGGASRNADAPVAQVAMQPAASRDRRRLRLQHARPERAAVDPARFAAATRQRRNRLPIRPGRRAQSQRRATRAPSRRARTMPGRRVARRAIPRARPAPRSAESGCGRSHAAIAMRRQCSARVPRCGAPAHDAPRRPARPTRSRARRPRTASPSRRSRASTSRASPRAAIRARPGRAARSATLAASRAPSRRRDDACHSPPRRRTDHRVADAQRSTRSAAITRPRQERERRAGSSAIADVEARAHGATKSKATMSSTDRKPTRCVDRIRHRVRDVGRQEHVAGAALDQLADAAAMTRSRSRGAPSACRPARCARSRRRSGWRRETRRCRRPPTHGASDRRCAARPCVRSPAARAAPWPRRRTRRAPRPASRGRRRRRRASSRRAREPVTRCPGHGGAIARARPP